MVALFFFGWASYELLDISFDELKKTAIIPKENNNSN